MLEEVLYDAIYIFIESSTSFLYTVKIYKCNTQTKNR